MKKQVNSFIIIFLTTFVLWSQASVDSLVLQLKNATNDSIKVKLYIALGDEFVYSNPDKSIQYYNQSLKFAQKSNYPLYIAKSHKAIAKFYYDKSDNSEALKHFKLAQIYFEKAKNYRESGRAYMNIGNVYLNQNSYNQAYEYFLKALRIAEKENYLSGLSAAYNNIGLVYKESHDALKAIDYYNRSIKIATQLNDKRGISASLTNIGNVYADEKKYVLANEYYFKSLKIDTELDDKYGMVICFNNIAEVYVDLEDFSGAQKYYENGIQLALEIGNKSMLSLLHLNLSKLNVKQNQLEEARKNTEFGLKYAKMTNDYKAQGRAYELFSNIAANQNNYKQAYEYHKLFKSYNDSLSEHDKMLKIKNLDVLLEADFKNKEIQELSESNKQSAIQITNQKILIYGFVFLIFIVLLFSLILLKQNREKVKLNTLLTLNSVQIEEKNTEIMKQHADLEALNKTKDRFFSIIGHDLKNPLHSILGFSELLYENNEKYDPEKRRRFLYIIKESAQRANDLLENLLNWALAQSNTIEYKPEKVTLKNVIEEVFGLHQAQASKKGIKLQSNFSINCVVYADKNMVFTILRNLISNAIKFSDSNSDVVVLVNPKSEFCEVTVKDNGVGISDKDLPFLFDFNTRSKIEKKKNSGSGLGLILCKDFVEKCGGTIRVNSKIGEGTEFIFTLPSYKEQNT